MSIESLAEIAELNALHGVSPEEARLKFFENLNASIIRDYFEKDMACPCDECPLRDSCAESYAECSAFRNWAVKGQYNEATIGKHLRVPKD